MVTFVDRVTLHLRAGKGGNGCVSVRREKFKPLAGPALTRRLRSADRTETQGVKPSRRQRQTGAVRSRTKQV